MAIVEKEITPEKAALMKDGDPLEQIMPVGEEGVGNMHDHFGASWKHRNIGMEAANAFEHYHYFRTHDKELSVSEDKLKKPRPAIVVGSGESLDSVMDVLGDWRGGLFCSTSHITTFAHYGIYPTHVVSPDPKGSMSEWAMPDINLQRLFETSIYACTPIQPSEYTEFWKGRRRWYLIFDPTKEWYAQILKPTFGWIKDLLLPFSANVPALLGIAHFLGYHPIYLIGADSCGHRFTQCNYINGEWKSERAADITTSHIVKTHHGKISNPNLMWAWRGLLCVARCNLEVQHGADWHIYNCAKDGALVDNFPYADLRKVIARQAGGVPWGDLKHMPWTRAKQVWELDLGLARFNTFIIPIHNGIESGTRVHIFGPYRTPDGVWHDGYEDAERQVGELNKQLYDGVAMWEKLTDEQRDKIKAAGAKFNPKLVKGPEISRYMAYVRKLKEEIRRRNGLPNK